MMYAQEIIPDLSTMNNEQLAKLYQENCPEALEVLCARNKNLVMDYACRYLSSAGNSLSLDDLYMAGNCGLIKAAERFNYALGYRFSTYATWWIQQAISREVDDNSHTVRIPIHMQERIRRITRMQNELLHQGFSYEESIWEIEEALKYTGTPLSEKQIEECIRVREQNMRCASLDMPVGEDSDTLLIDFIPDNRKDNPETLLILTMLRGELAAQMTKLDSRERMIINERFGTDGQGRRTLEEIGRTLKVSRERVRQIEAKALRKLKAGCMRAHLGDYLEEMTQWA